MASEPDAEASPRPATRTCDASLSKPHGAIVVRQGSGTDCEDDKRAFQKRRKRLRGRRNTDCIAVFEAGRSRQGQRKIVTALHVNCWALSGLLEPEPRLFPGSKLQPDNNQSKDKNFLKKLRTPNR